MATRLDITNQRFGRLIALQPEFHRRRRWHWLCACDCGRRKVINGTSLRRGATLSCGCLNQDNGWDRAIDISGQRFGRLLVLKDVGRRGSKRLWLCHCDCGKQKVVGGDVLRNGHSRSCGCLKRDTTRAIMTKHGHTSLHNPSPTYSSWGAMLARCRNKQRANYGGRGIAVCERWHAFEHFLLDMGERPPGTTLDRIDNNGNYEPGNCRWATDKEQSANKRRKNGAQKLTPADVIAIRKDTRPNHIIAETYGISRSAISKIKWRQNWQDVA